MKKIITIISVCADTLQRTFSVATDVFSIIATVALMLIRTGLSVFAAQVLFDFVHKAQMGASGYVVAFLAMHPYFRRYNPTLRIPKTRL